MRRIEPLFAAPFERHMRGEEHTILEELDRISKDMDVEHAGVSYPARCRDCRRR